MVKHIATRKVSRALPVAAAILLLSAGATVSIAIGAPVIGTQTAVAATVHSPEPLIYVIGANASNAFWLSEGRGADAAGRAFHVNVRYEAPSVQGDVGMITLIDAALGAHPAGIAIDYTDRTMEPSVLKAEAEHVDVVLYNNNRFSPQSGGATTNPAVTSLGFSGQNESLSGSILATALLKYLPKSGGTVLLGDAYPNVYVLSLRGEGIKKVLDANGYKTQQLNMSDNEVLDESLVGAYLTAHHGVVGYIGLSGDPETNAAARWVEAHHLNIALATFDVEPETIALMKSVPSFDLALDQQPYLQGYYAVENLALEIEDGFSPVQVNTGSLLVTKQNLPAVERLVNEGVD